MIRKILVVDDSAIARKILLSCMPKERGFEIYQAVDGEDGLNKFKEVRPELTFLDITMPVLDGFQALKAIRTFDAEAVVIICTADIQPQSLSRAKSLGALMVLGKPPTKEGVAQAILSAEEVFR